MSEETRTGASFAARLGFWAGLAAGSWTIGLAPLLPRPDGLSVSAFYLIGVTLIVGIWWITEALPLGATALIPAAAFPLLGVASADEVSPAYASPFILLLLGGFLLAMAVERSGVHRRLALNILLRVGTSPRRLVLGFAIAAAILSMWISNTATTLIMMPVALAIADRSAEKGRAFGVGVLLAVAYGASVGGMATPVGTPPNLIAMEHLEARFPDGPTLNFVTWSFRAVPVVLVIIPVVWLSLVYVYPRISRDLDLGARTLILRELQLLGPWRPAEVRSLAVFGLAAILWVTRPEILISESLRYPGWAEWLEMPGAKDATVALLVAVIAFAVPSGEASEAPGTPLLPWSTAQQAPWGLVLLFGGGVALSKGFDKTGLSSFLGHYLAEFASVGSVKFVAISALSATFGTEIISNTALANITMPILASTAQQASLDPRVLLVPVAMACSCAFMMPAATGPNAIVFGTGKIRIHEMVRAGFLANWAAWLIIVGFTAIFLALP